MSTTQRRVLLTHIFLSSTCASGTDVHAVIMDDGLSDSTLNRYSEEPTVSTRFKDNSFFKDRFNSKKVTKKK